MPHQISTESNALGLVLSFSGVVSGAELLDLNARLIAEESFSRWRYQLWDFTNADRLDITIEQLRGLARQDKAASAKNPAMRTAIVGRPLFFAGLDRIFEIFEEVWTTYQPKFFSDVETARAWASSDRT